MTFAAESPWCAWGHGNAQTLGQDQEGPPCVWEHGARVAILRVPPCARCHRNASSNACLRRVHFQERAQTLVWSTRRCRSESHSDRVICDMRSCLTERAAVRSRDVTFAYGSQTHRWHHAAGLQVHSEASSINASQTARRRVRSGAEGDRGRVRHASACPGTCGMFWKRLLPPGSVPWHDGAGKVASGE